MDRELQTKKKITDGAIDFHKDPWSTIPAGALGPRARIDRVCLCFSSSYLTYLLVLDVTFSAKGLVARLLIHSPLHRSTVHQALQSAWITEDLSELESAYQERIGSA